MEIEVVSERIPGAAPVTPHSRFSAVAEAASAMASPSAPSGGAPLPSLVRVVSLDGEWRRRAFEADPPEMPVGPDFDDHLWERVLVPDNYGLEPALSMHYGPVFYRRRLAPLDAPDSLLVFDAVDYLADVWLDSEHLGHHEGYFAPFCFDVTGKIREGSVLTVRVQDPLEELEDAAGIIGHAKRCIKGTMNYHDSRPGGLPGLTPGWTARLGQSLSTGGITGRVNLHGCGPVRIDALFATPLDEQTGLVHIAVVLTNNSGSPLDAGLDLVATTPSNDLASAALSTTLAPGPNRIDARVKLLDPVAWWPVSHADLGRPALYVLQAQAVVDGAVSDTRSARFGLRTAKVATDTEVHAHHLELNGRPVFVQAANYIPRQHFAGVDVEFYRRDMWLAAEAHLNSFGVHAHLQSPHCYDAADEEGILIFQDFPLQWRYDSGSETNPGFTDKACRQIAEMAYTYWNHPSIVYWVCHNEPMAMFVPKRDPDPAKDFDNQVLDEALERRLREVEPVRHVHRASGIGDDLHAYDGSLGGGEAYGIRERRSWFVSEYGFWTLGAHSHRWNDQGWPPDEFQMKNWLSRLSFGPSTMAFTGLPERYDSFEAWQQATEAYGAFLAKYQTEWMRINRGDPFYAYRWHFFADWWGWAGGGLVDVDRQPKATYTALAAASRPVLVATSLPHTVFPPGSKLEFPIHAVNERRKEAHLQVIWRWRRADPSLVVGVDPEVCTRYRAVPPPKGGSMVAVSWGEPGRLLAEGRIESAVPPESARLLETISLAVPQEEMAGATLELHWGAGETNWYHVLAAPEGWFCGPGAFVVAPDGMRRLGQEPRVY